ncbi:hypothetical protein GN244_ATG11144 [Phytophthora infestans]|uniref:Uncharacterized protein n=1 Tax=Phytophthora infestans TaxID=4787 RepID=A0A833S060_PHYIN|nr:hypothetical protein GN244_ATG11144 [Phytophthora infestans]
MQRNGVLPAINAGTPSVAHRGVSPNVAKRAAWFTPRDGLGTPDRRTEQQSLASVAVPADGAFQPRHEQSPTITQPTSTSLEDALEVLHEVLIETDNQSDSAQRRDAALGRLRVFTLLKGKSSSERDLLLTSRCRRHWSCCRLNLLERDALKAQGKAPNLS